MRAVRAGGAMVCGLALLLGACAAPRPPVKARISAKSVSRLAANGTVVVVRPVTDQELTESAPWRAVLLRAADPDAAPHPSALVEIVVREDSGRTVALIQPPQPGCAAGSRVLVVPEEPARCASIPAPPLGGKEDRVTGPSGGGPAQMSM